MVLLECKTSATVQYGKVDNITKSDSCWHCKLDEDEGSIELIS